MNDYIEHGRDVLIAVNVVNALHAKAKGPVKPNIIVCSISSWLYILLV